MKALRNRIALLLVSLIAAGGIASSVSAASLGDIIVKYFDGFTATEVSVTEPTVQAILGYNPLTNRMESFDLSADSGLSLDTNFRQFVINGLSQTRVSGLSESLDNIRDRITTLETAVTSLTPVPPTITSGVSRSIVTSATATGTMLSTAKTSNVMYSVGISTTANIAGGADGYVVLETSQTNSATSTWTTINQVRNGQAVSLALVLQSVQNNVYTIMGNIPAGYFMRLRSVTVSGSPTYTFIGGQEMQF